MHPSTLQLPSFSSPSACQILSRARYFRRAHGRGLQGRFMCVPRATGFPVRGAESAASPFHFSSAHWGARWGAGGSVSAERRVDHRAPRRPSACETVRKAGRPGAPGGAGAGPRLPQPAFVSLRKPLLLAAEPRRILQLPVPFSVPAETPPSPGPCALLPWASRNGFREEKARLGPARPRRRRVPGSVTPASLWGRGPPWSWGRPPSRLPGSLMPRPVARFQLGLTFPAPGAPA